MIYLFTATPLDRPYYKRDLLNTCCYPIKLDMQFVYHRPWVEEKLRKNTAELKNKEAMVVFCEFSENGSSSKYIYHPIRLAKISSVLPEGEFITILLRLGRFFDYEKIKDNSQVVIDEFQKLVNKFKLKPVPKKKIPKYFVSSHTEWRKDGFSEDERAWVGLLEHMRNRESLKDSTFFKIKRFSEVKNFQKAKLKDINSVNFLNNKPAYKLRSGKAYQIILQLFQRKNGEFLYPKINISEAIASITGPFLRQAPPELEVDFIIYCKKTFDIEPTRLSMFVPPDSPNVFQSPVFDFIAYIRRSVGHIILFFLSIMVGLILISTRQDYITSVGAWCSCPIKQFLTAHGLLISAVSKVLGAIILALANFIALRKLPTKLG